MRYRGGATSYLEVLDSETRYFAAQLALAQSRFERTPSIRRTFTARWEADGNELIASVQP